MMNLMMWRLIRVSIADVRPGADGTLRRPRAKLYYHTCQKMHDCYTRNVEILAEMTVCEPRKTPQPAGEILEDALEVAEILACSEC